MLEPKAVFPRYEREAPGDLLHVDIKKFACIKGVDPTCCDQGNLPPTCWIQRNAATWVRPGTIANLPPGTAGSCRLDAIY
jgi:hypothetical protein